MTWNVEMNELKHANPTVGIGTYEGALYVQLTQGPVTWLGSAELARFVAKQLNQAADLLDAQQAAAQRAEVKKP